MIPWHWGIPWHWVIPITLNDTLTLSDTDTLSDFSSHWQFSQPTQEFTHYTEGPWFPHKQTGHWVIPMTLSDTLTLRYTITLSDTLTLSNTLTLSDTHYGHTQEDTHYTEWYPLRTHPRGYPLHWAIPIPWVIFPLTDSLTTHPRVHPLHWGTLFSSQTNRTLSDSPDTEGYPWHGVIPITLSSSNQ